MLLPFLTIPWRFSSVALFDWCTQINLCVMASSWSVYKCAALSAFFQWYFSCWCIAPACTRLNCKYPSCQPSPTLLSNVPLTESHKSDPITAANSNWWLQQVWLLRSHLVIYEWCWCSVYTVCDLWWLCVREVILHGCAEKAGSWNVEFDWMTSRSASQGRQAGVTWWLCNCEKRLSWQMQILKVSWR